MIKLRSCLPLLFLALSLGLSAQNCRFQLLMEDLVTEDGWNGGELTIRVDGVPTVYTLEDGSSQSVFFPVMTGDAVSLDFLSGPFGEEITFSILDNNDSLIYRGANLDSGTDIFGFTAACVACAPPPAATIELFRVRSTTTDIKFQPADPANNPQYRIEYGQGETFDPATDGNGEQLLRTDTMFRVIDLQPDTVYAFWISTICQTQEDTSARRGPFIIQTQKQADVGITALASPVSGCDLGAEAVTIGITNFGGEAQAFFNVDFAINGEAGGVGRPQDGIFTGVVGVDSTEFFTFDINAFLNVPGTYKLTVWTELEGDENNQNDTMDFFVVHTPLIAELPYTENFENSDGFWRGEHEGRSPFSWQWGIPNGASFDRAPQGQRAWVTNLRGDYNNREMSYLYSPCFDLSSRADDPFFSAVLQLEMENDFDRVWLEMTTDRGESWTKVLTSPAGYNWYNDLPNQWWESNDGFAAAPLLVGQLIENVAGLGEIQFRFAFQSSRDVTMEGVLVDAVSLGDRAENNLAAVTARVSSACFPFTNTALNFTFANVGTTTARDIDINYLLSGAVVTERFPDTLRPGQQAVFTASLTSANMFSDPFPIWVTLAEDVQASNDTAFVEFEINQPVPFLEDFSDGEYPDRWNNAGGIFRVASAPSGVLALFDTIGVTAGNNSFSTAEYTGIEATDSLRFTVTLSDPGTPDISTGFVRLIIGQEQCDATGNFVVIDTLRTGDYAFSLEMFEEVPVRFSFVFEAISGETVVEFNSISIPRCPEDLGLVTDILNVSDPEEDDGVATVYVFDGLAPYTFEWNTGETVASLGDLPIGSYDVTVTDALGCVDNVAFEVDFGTDAEDPEGLLASLSVSPNPTAGLLNLRLDLNESSELTATIYDLTGRELLRHDLGRSRQVNESLNLSNLPSGVYLLRVNTGLAARTVRVVRR